MIRDKKYLSSVVLIILVGFIVFSDIFSNGPLTPSDQPVHLATAEYVKNTLIPEYHWINGWYPYVFLGIPIQLYLYQLGTWIIILLSYIFPLVISFKLTVFLSLILPPLALFHLLYKRFNYLVGILPAILYFFQIAYNKMLLTGMWNSTLGLFFLLLQFYFLDKYKEELNFRRISLITALQALAVISHLFIGISSFILIGCHTLLNLYKTRDKKQLLWLTTIPLTILVLAFYLFPFLETSNWYKNYGWGLGDSIPEIIYKLTGMFFALQPNTTFIKPFLSSNFLEASKLLVRSIFENWPTLLIDILAMLGLIKYIKTEKNRMHFLDLAILSTIFMLILGTGFWYLFDIGKSLPILSGFITYKFVYFTRITIYILAGYYLFKRQEIFTPKRVNLILLALLVLLLIFPTIYKPHESFTETFEETKLKQETELLSSWIAQNIEKDAAIIDPITFDSNNQGFTSQSRVLALLPLETKIPMVSTWFSSYYPIEKQLSSDDLKVFNIPRKEIRTEELKEKMETFNTKYLLTIEDAMKNKLNQDKDFKIKKDFGTYTLYDLTTYKSAITRVKHNVIKKTEQELIITTNLKESTTTEIKIAYHPYWGGYINNRKIELIKSKNNLIELNIPEGQNTIKLVYSSIKPVHIITSLITILFMIIFSLKIKPFKK